MTRVHSPIVFCHNDIQGGNILLRKKAPNVSSAPNDRIMLIDYEFCGYNFRGYDIVS